MTQAPWQPPGAPAQPQQPQQGGVWPQQPVPAALHQPVGTAQTQAPAGIPSLSGASVGNQQGRRLPSGYEYVVEIDQVGVKMTGQSGLRFIVEFTVVESGNPSVRPGETFSWTRPFDDQYGYGPADIKGWICMLVEKLVPDSSPGTQWDDQFTAWVSGEQQPARGTTWRTAVWDKPLKTPTANAQVIAIIDWSIWDGRHLAVGPAPAALPVQPAPVPPAPAPAAAPAAPAGAPPGWPAVLPYPPRGVG